jgi:hypothetical protein
MKIWPILGGCVCIAIGIFGKRFFASDIAGGSISDESLPRWLGIAVFVLVGMLLIIGGLFAEP